MYEYIDAEESLISCLISRPQCIEDVYGMVSPEMFESAVLGRAYFEYRQAFDEHKELTIIGLKQALAAEFPDYEVDDAIKRSVVMQAMPFQIKNYAEVMVRHYKKTCVDAMLNRMEIKEADIDNQIDKMIAGLEQLQGGAVSEGYTIAEITEKYKDDYFCDRDKSVTYLGWDAIDDLTGGFQGGDLVLLGGRPATGKSSLACQWAEMYAKQGKKVGYYNLEMGERSVFERLVAAKSGIEVVRIRKATTFHNEEKELYTKAIRELSGQGNIILFTGSKRISDIRNDMRKFKFDIIILDYLQLIIPEGRYAGNRTAEVGEISRMCKELCMDYNTKMLALTQLNRTSEARRDREPSLADLRESGSLEQDASIVFLLWNTDLEDRSRKALKTEKSRNGKCDRVDMIFDGSHLSFKIEEETPFGS